MSRSVGAFLGACIKGNTLHVADTEKGILISLGSKSMSYLLIKASPYQCVIIL